MQANKGAITRCSNLSRRDVFGTKHNWSNHFYRDFLSNTVEGKTRFLQYYFIEASYYSLLKPEVVLLWQM